MRLAAGLTILALAAAPLPAGAQGLLESAADCIEATERPICLLKVTADRDGGSDIWRDPDLREAPRVLAEIGVTPAGVAAARGGDAAGRTFFGASDEAETAVAEALALDRSGRPPAEALRPIQELDATPPPVPLFFAGQGEEPSPRTVAWVEIFRAEPSDAPKASTAFLRAAAQAWERELAAPGAPSSLKASAPALARAWARLDDASGFDRLQVRLSPIQRIEVLTELDRLPEAVAAALALRREDVVVAARAELRREGERIGRLRQQAAAQIVPFLEQQVREARGRGDTAMAELFEEQLRHARRAPAPKLEIPRIPEDEVQSRADGEIGMMQDQILRQAARSGDPRVAWPLAHAVLTTPGLHENLYRFAPTLRASDPAVAAAHLESLERGLTARHGSENLEQIAAGWRAIGRSDRFPSLLERVQPWAAADHARARPGGYDEVTARLLHAEGRVAEARALAVLPPNERLEIDIAAGRGVGNLDTYLAETSNESDRVTTLVACVSRSEAARRYADALTCLRRRYEVLATPSQRHAAAHQAISVAGKAASVGDDVATARALLEFGLRTGVEANIADPGMRGWPAGFYATDLIAVAKAELRADGRLPPRPKEQTMLGRAP
ncbi:hypothetical protein [Phenylobacterium sp.]|uniref:hypothetical protein n=1 Tax=Phenylobacterium sp. TaxID=1871053 RepID=UPI002EDABDB9